MGSTHSSRCERTWECGFDPGPITDEEIGETGGALFAFLDYAENAAANER